MDNRRTLNAQPNETWRISGLRRRELCRILHNCQRSLSLSSRSESRIDVHFSCNEGDNVDIKNSMKEGKVYISKSSLYTSATVLCVDLSYNTALSSWLIVLGAFANGPRIGGFPQYCILNFDIRYNRLNFIFVWVFPFHSTTIQLLCCRSIIIELLEYYKHTTEWFPAITIQLWNDVRFEFKNVKQWYNNCSRNDYKTIYIEMIVVPLNLFHVHIFNIIVISNDLKL